MSNGECCRLNKTNRLHSYHPQKNIKFIHREELKTRQREHFRIKAIRRVYQTAKRQQTEHNKIIVKKLNVRFIRDLSSESENSWESL